MKTNQDDTTNFFVLLAEELEDQMKEGDVEALSSELADFIIEKGGL